MSKIAFLPTGGTIASAVTAQSGGKAVPSLTGHDFLARARDLMGSDLEIIVEDIANLPGSQITPEIMKSLCWKTLEYAGREDIDGVVVTQGTDAIEECAYFIDVCYGGDKPVVFTGAMRTASEAGYEGIENLLAAFAVASGREARGCGVLHVMNQEIHAAGEVRKMHTLKPNAFQSPPLGPLGEIVYGMVDIRRFPRRPKKTLAPEYILPVSILPMYIGIRESDLSWVFDFRPKGIVVEGLGGGRIPAFVVPVFKKLIESGIPVLETTRCGIGHLNDGYGYSGAHSNLKEIGVLFAHNLNAAKARIKLMLALGNFADPRELREYFASPFD